MTSKSKVFVLAVTLAVVTLGAGSVAGASGGSTTNSVPAKHAPAKLGLPAATPLRALSGRVIILNIKGMPLIILPKPAHSARYAIASTPAGVVVLRTVKSGTEQAPAIAALKVGRAAVTLHSTGGGRVIKFTVVVTSRALKPVVSGPPLSLAEFAQWQGSAPQRAQEQRYPAPGTAGQSPVPVACNYEWGRGTGHHQDLRARGATAGGAEGRRNISHSHQLDHEAARNVHGGRPKVITARRRCSTTG